MKRELFEAASGLSEEERMPCVSPLGYPAEKRSIREIMMRKGVGADVRLPAEKLFFDGEWGVPYAFSAEDECFEPLEMVRWAPSAVNRQPWRIIVRGGRFCFYKKQDKGYISDKKGDLQRVDMGIALCHFITGLEAQGKQPELEIRDPGICVPSGVEYIATVTGIQ